MISIHAQEVKSILKHSITQSKILEMSDLIGDQIGVYLLVGFPGQTAEQIEEDVDRVLAAGALPKLAEYSPIPGTRMWREALEVAAICY